MCCLKQNWCDLQLSAATWYMMAEHTNTESCTERKTTENPHRKTCKHPHLSSDGALCKTSSRCLVLPFRPLRREECFHAKLHAEICQFSVFSSLTTTTHTSSNMAWDFWIHQIHSARWHTSKQTAKRRHKSSTLKTRSAQMHRCFLPTKESVGGNGKLWQPKINTKYKRWVKAICIIFKAGGEARLLSCQNAFYTDGSGEKEVKWLFKIGRPVNPSCYTNTIHASGCSLPL